MPLITIYFITHTGQSASIVQDSTLFDNTKWQALCRYCKLNARVSTFCYKNNRILGEIVKTFHIFFFFDLGGRIATKVFIKIFVIVLFCVHYTICFLFLLVIICSKNHNLIKFKGILWCYDFALMIDNN